MGIGKLEAYLERGLDGQKLYIFVTDGEHRSIAKPLELEPVTDGIYIEPTLRLPYRDDAFLQSLVDQAWDMGIRPRHAKDGKPEVEALKNHLEDMRSLVFKQKGTNK